MQHKPQPFIWGIFIHMCLVTGHWCASGQCHLLVDHCLLFSFGTMCKLWCIAPLCLQHHIYFEYFIGPFRQSPVITPWLGSDSVLSNFSNPLFTSYSTTGHCIVWDAGIIILYINTQSSEHRWAAASWSEWLYGQTLSPCPQLYGSWSITICSLFEYEGV
jgi:hypothetical protein